jgi:hypothetical protein
MLPVRARASRGLCPGLPTHLADALQELPLGGVEPSEAHALVSSPAMGKERSPGSARVAHTPDDSEPAPHSFAESRLPLPESGGAPLGGPRPGSTRVGTNGAPMHPERSYFVSPTALH